MSGSRGEGRPKQASGGCRPAGAISLLLGAALLGVGMAGERSRAGLQAQIDGLHRQVRLDASSSKQLKADLESCKKQLAQEEAATATAVAAGKTAAEKCQSAVDAAQREADQARQSCEASKEATRKEVAAAREQAQAEAQPQVDEAVSAARLDLAAAVLGADVRVLKNVLAAHESTLAAAWEAQLAAQPKRGILVVAGSRHYLVNAFVSLWGVRRYWNSTLPIAIMYWGEFEWEYINPATQIFFEEHLGDDVRFIDASSDFPWPAHHRPLFLPGQDRQREGWKVKMAAAYLAPFQEVLYLDADSTPVVSPESLFRHKSYLAGGALFWPDTPCQRPRVFDELAAMGLLKQEDLPGASERETESGQWLLDRRRHRLPLEYIMLMATHAEFTFSMAFGDKDLFRVGFALAGAGEAYYLVEVGLGFAWGPADPTRNGARLMRGYVQHSTRGQPLFHHRAGWKTKYDLNHPENRTMDAISAPLPCAWSTKHWPFDYPGEKDDELLQEIDPADCPYSVTQFAKAVSTCSGGFDGSAGQRVPLFNIKGSDMQGVHSALEEAWQVVQSARSQQPELFENRDED